jgi:hypothetical protein
LERTPLAILKLTGSGNIKRALDYEKKDASAPPLPADRQEEIRQLDALILKCLKACSKGSIRNRKSNPAFSHLSLLVSIRERLLRGHQPGKESDADVVAQAERMLAGAGK